MRPELKKPFKLTQGMAYFTGKNVKTERHSHHALEFIFGIDRPFDLISDKITLKNVYSAVITPNCRHQFTGENALYLFVYLEPELFQVNQIENHYNLISNEIVTLNPLVKLPSPKNVLDFSFFIEVLNIPLIHTEIPKIDKRIVNTISLIKNNLEQGRISSDTLSKSIFLSEGRFAHLFKEQIGIPVRRYILWCRIQETLRELLRGGNFTQSAHAAGFSDSAHFTRTFSEMFGVSPSSVLKK